MLLLDPAPPSTLGPTSLAPAEFYFTCEEAPAAEWHVRRFTLREALCEPYSLAVDLLTASLGVDVAALLGARCTLEICRGVDGRLVHGLVTQVRTLGVFSGRLAVRVEVAPAVSLLSQQTDTRFWQDRTAPQILREVLQPALRDLGAALDMRIEEAAHLPREYCVQYRETDLDFAARLMHEEGLVWFFTHAADRAGETLVILDSTARAQELDHPLGAVPYVAQSTGAARCQSVSSFDWHGRLTTTAVEQRDWNWRDVESAPYHRHVDARDARGRVRTRHHHDERRLERDDGLARARRELEAHRAGAELGLGESDVLELLPGHTVTLRGLPRPDLDGDYLLVRVHHRGDAPEEDQFAAGPAEPRYLNTFECVRADRPYRPPHAPPRPRVYGPHTAIVVGPPREEIHTDEHGRIKVRFHWDRRSPPDDTASCWIRVAQAAAGPGWGAMFIPRVGMEVLVEFIDGDPDRPLVTGCVYNSLNPPPHALPDHKTRSTFRSESSPGGGGFNELRVEDARGREEIFVHAQRDLREVVLHDNTCSVGHDQILEVAGEQRLWVGRDQTIEIHGDRVVTVGEGDLITHVVTGKSTTTVHDGRSVVVERGDDSLKVYRGGHSTTAELDVTMTSRDGRMLLNSRERMALASKESQLSLIGETQAELIAWTAALTLRGHTDVALSSQTTRVEVSAPNEVCVTSPQVVDISGGTIRLAALEKLVLSVGATSITLDPAGVTVSAPRITSAAVGIHEITGALIKIN
ncbi:type VI secretion system secreted protein VgrG [Nannocystis exedens]|uniref:Type VI secretion system secreted protein VgrG n=1 Tax=Nannocystis exedens TaxID=54 RepID=A0A1I2FFB4_9BACT|nr:type VI secretion system tip protein TssI/VgrG [Nannocystis exedens]PCC70454.1 Phage-related baseplate assembly protein [Nannocystis exedens]SFF04082.1 type VI secretion system secreted protein VgrG [Nannocystis exedens]